MTARQRGSKHFEVWSSRRALAYKRGEEVNLEDILAVETIFEMQTEEIGAESDIINSFETTDPFEIAAVILKSGELQLTAEQRKRMLEEKRKRLSPFPEML